MACLRRLDEKHNGAGFGCWCTWFHTRVDRPEGGSPNELPRIYHRKEYDATRTGDAPDYRVTCLFVDRDYRRKGYPRDTKGKKVSSSFLYSATRSLFGQAGFGYDRPKCKFNCVMRRTVSPVEDS